MSTKWIMGILTVLIVSSTIAYITFMNDLKIRVDDDKTTFYVKETWWRVTGREYNKLFDGTSQMNRDRSSIKVDTVINPDNTTTITRYTKYIRGPVIVDTYYFDGMATDVELFPIEHKIEIYNASGKFYRYEVRDLYYDGETQKLEAKVNEWNFGKNMKVEWEIPFRWAWVYKSGIMKVQYYVNSDYFVLHNRLYDPDSYLKLDSVADNRTYEYETTATITTDYSYITIYDLTDRYTDYPLVGFYYQESANESTTYGLSNGTCYTNFTSNAPCDGNESTAMTTGYSMWVNYTKPSKALSGTYWQIIYFNPSQGRLNQSIYSDCWSAYTGKIVLKADYSSTVSWRCYNGTAWRQIAASAGDMYEEGIWWQINQSPIEYTIDTLRYDIADNSSFSSSDKNISEIYSPDEIYRAEVNITASGASDIQIDYAGSSISFPGTLYSTGYLMQDEFSYSGISYTAYNLTFESAETKTIYINYSAEGNYSRVGYFNFTLTGFTLDSANELSNTETMENLNVSDATYLGTMTNVSDSFNEYEVTESFLDNNAYTDRWYSSEGSFDTSCSLPVAGCLNDACSGSSDCSSSVVRMDDYFYMPNISYFTLSVYGATFQGAEAYLEITDLSNNVQLIWLDSNYVGQACSYPSGCSALVFGNLTFRKEDEDTWNISISSYSITTNQGGVGILPTSTGTEFDVSGLDTPYYLRWRATPDICSYQAGPCIANIEFATFHIKGPQLNKTNTTYSGIEGPGASSLTGNWTSPLINRTAENISRATLSAHLLLPDNTEIQPYMSNDDGTTWENVVFDENYLFSSTGNELRVRFEFNSTDNYSSPIVLDYTVDIIPTAMSGLTVDVGADGQPEVEYDYELNSTSTPVYFEANDSSFNKYLNDSCSEDEYCNIPIAFTSDSGGIIEIKNVNLTENINPISFDYSLFQDDEYVVLSPSQAMAFTGFKFDYRGNKNITIEAHDAGRSSSINLTVQVVYSPIDLFFPSNALYWQIFPSKRNQSNIEPYGQNSSHGVWNVNTSAYHEQGVDIYAKYNDSITSCVTKMEFRGQNFSVSTLNNISTLNITNLTTSAQKLIEGLNSSTLGNIRSYTMINCSGYSGTFIVPYFCFFTLCSDCVKTQDWDDTCDVYE